MLNLEELATRFINHVGTLRSATFVCSVPTALEGWFRAEVVPALEDLGIQQDAIDPRFIYPGTQQQADLAVRTPGGLVVFEFMHFVIQKDRKKIKRLPVQLNRLEEIVGGGIVQQGMASLTFNGYSKNTREGLLRKFFGERLWQVAGPLQVMPVCPLFLVLAGFTGKSKAF